MCMGLDSAKERWTITRTASSRAASRPCRSTGPVRATEYDFALCPEYEKPFKAVFDYLATRTDVDNARAGIWGVSLGGYLRAARSRVSRSVSKPAWRSPARSSAPPTSPGARR